MKTFEIDCFEVVQADSCGVRDDHYAFVSSEKLAKEIVDQSKGWRNYHRYKKTIMVFDSAAEIDANSKKEIRKAALKKLSAVELEALGLS